MAVSSAGLVLEDAARQGEPEVDAEAAQAAAASLKAPFVDAKLRTRQSLRRRLTAAATLLVAGLLIAATVVAWRARAAAGSLSVAFDRFVHQYGKVYSSPAERHMRQVIFETNFAAIEAENARGLPYRLAVNEFADLTPEEFQAYHLGFASGGAAAADAPSLPPVPGAALSRNASDNSSLPAEVDWVAKGAVTTPKNQGKCGACWAFSTTGALEGAWQIATGQLLSLSEQQLVDCSKGNNGCGGGLMDEAFSYLQKRPVCTEANYSYAGVSRSCHASCDAGIPAGAVVGYVDVPSYDEKALMEAVAKQPVSVAIEADQLAFQLYGGGVLTKQCGAKLDHGVLLVGYGSEGDMPYWKVKNS